MLSLEELAILVNLDSATGLSKADLVALAISDHQSPRFDRHVALATIDSMLGLSYAAKDIKGLCYLTQSGQAQIDISKANSGKLLRKLIYG